MTRDLLIDLALDPDPDVDPPISYRRNLRMLREIGGSGQVIAEWSEMLELERNYRECS